MVKFLNTTPLPSRIFVGEGMNIFFDPPLSMKFFNDEGSLLFTSIYKPNIKSGFSLQPFISQEKSLYFLVDI